MDSTLRVIVSHLNLLTFESAHEVYNLKGHIYLSLMDYQKHHHRSAHGMKPGKHRQGRNESLDIIYLFHRAVAPAPSKREMEGVDLQASSFTNHSKKASINVCLLFSLLLRGFDATRSSFRFHLLDVIRHAKNGSSTLYISFYWGVTKKPYLNSRRKLTGSSQPKLWLALGALPLGPPAFIEPSTHLNQCFTEQHSTLHHLLKTEEI